MSFVLVVSVLSMFASFAFIIINLFRLPYSIDALILSVASFIFWSMWVIVAGEIIELKKGKG
jgi:hypothetical protein